MRKEKLFWNRVEEKYKKKDREIGYVTFTNLTVTVAVNHTVEVGNALSEVCKVCIVDGRHVVKI